jgi:NodT family efflux transporter outer membrane factor (OMF) lipoprotein
VKLRTRLLTLGTSALLLAGCASYSGIAPETAKLDGATLLGKGQVYAGWPQQNWWSELQDPALNDLIEQALNGSPGLQAAAARLRRAGAIAGQTESTLWPQLRASASSTRERFSENGLIPPPYAGTTQNVNELQLAGQWELDFFGKNREALRAALGEVRASEAEQQAARQFLAGNVARGYYNLARLLAQRELAETRQQQRQALAQLVERRFKAGIDTRVELESAKGVVPENARDIAALDEQISLARHALAALIGKQPDAVDTLSPKLPAVAPLALPKSLPADLLGHRADVVAARWRVESAVHGLESTQALFYPNVNLNVFAGFSAIGFNQWLDSGSRQPGIGLAVTLPIFDAGRLRSLYRVSAASVDASVASYNSTLLDALRDVADQLSTLQSLETQLQRQQATQASAQRSYDLALQRYRADISDRLNVLNVESGLIAQRRASIDLQARWIDARIRLITALGGGFAEAPAPALASTAADKNTQN